jgi:hypothetical protein
MYMQGCAFQVQRRAWSVSANRRNMLNELAIIQFCKTAQHRRVVGGVERVKRPN